MGRDIVVRSRSMVTARVEQGGLVAVVTKDYRGDDPTGEYRGYVAGPGGDVVELLSGTGYGEVPAAQIAAKRLTELAPGRVRVREAQM